MIVRRLQQTLWKARSINFAVSFGCKDQKQDNEKKPEEPPKQARTNKYKQRFINFANLEQRYQLHELYKKIKIIKMYSRSLTKYININQKTDSADRNKDFLYRLYSVLLTGLLGSILLIRYYEQKNQNPKTNKQVKVPGLERKIEKVSIRTSYYSHHVVHEATITYDDKSVKKIPIANPNYYLHQLQKKSEELKEKIPVYFVDDYFDNPLEVASYLLWGGLAIYGCVLLYGMRKGFNILSLFNRNKMNKKINSERDITTRFKDVAGMDQAKLEIVEFVQFLQKSKKFKEMGAKIPRGALLTGPPGTGKTMLAKACAGEAGVPFFYVSGSEFIEMFVGMGASRVRDLFREARQASPSIIFVDEIDAIGGKRDSGGNDERDSTLNQLLVEMDGFDTDMNVVVLAATNRRQVLDSALTRPGRFDRLIEVDLPDIGGRIDIFKVHLKPLKLDPSKSLEQFAKRLATLTPGFSGADIANLCNEAAIMAARKNKKVIQSIDFQMATERIIAGMEKKNMMTEEEKKIVSYHEAGHAVTAWFLAGGDPLVKVTIIPRSKGSLGYAQYLPNQSSLKTREQLMDRVMIIMGGRLSEQHFFGKITTGAADDLQKVYQVCRAMVTQFGMSSKIGNIGYPRQDYVESYSKQTAKTIDLEIMAIVRECEVKCRILIKQKAEMVQKLALKLIEKESLNAQEIKEVLGERPFEPSENYTKYMQEQVV